MGRSDYFAGAFLDTNILVSMSYEIKKEHDSVFEILDLAAEFDINFFVTVTTKSEFIEFQWRLLMTEGLIDLVDAHSEVKITRAAKAAIDSATGSMRANVARGSDPVFTDIQLKNIKRSFSASEHSGSMGWLKVCKHILSGRLSHVENYLIEQGVSYISPHVGKDEIYEKQPEWGDAIHISEATNLSVSDSMILNALEATKCPFVISLDFDIGYAALSGSIKKDVVMPDEQAKDFRNFHFPL